jgi:uncharacterized protein (TIGR00106 family)
MHSAGTTVGKSRFTSNHSCRCVLRQMKELGAEATYGYLCTDCYLRTEGSWDDVMKVIGQCHAMLHENGVVRIQSDIRVGSRTDKKQSHKDKVEAVEKLLKEDA